MTIKMSEGRVFFMKTCSVTKKEYKVEVSLTQFVRIRSSKEPIQYIAPRMSPEDREFIISGHTPEEWNKLFNEPKTP